MHTLLDREAPGLFHKLERSSLEGRRRAIAAGVLAVAEILGDLPAAVRELVERAHSTHGLSPQEVESAWTLAETADEEFIDLQERGEGQPALRRFSEARLVTALATGFGGTSANDAADAIYELCKATDSPSIVVDSIEKVMPENGTENGAPDNRRE